MVHLNDWEYYEINGLFMRYRNCLEKRFNTCTSDAEKKYLQDLMDKMQRFTDVRFPELLTELKNQRVKENHEKRN